MSQNRPFTRMRDALWVLTAALKQADVLHDRGQITVRLDRDAGRRLEVWVRSNVMLSPRLAGGEDPVATTRWLELDGIRFEWPVRVVALPGGETALEPTVLPFALPRLG